MKEIHLTVNDARIPGVRYLREMKTSTNKRRRDTTYTSKMIERKAIEYCQRYFSICKDIVAYMQDSDSVTEVEFTENHVLMIPLLLHLLVFVTGQR